MARTNSRAFRANGAASRSPLRETLTRRLERWRVVVGVGWGGVEVAHPLSAAGGAGVVVLSALGGDAVGAVLLSGPGPSGHHRGPVTAVVGRRAGFGRRHVAGGSAEAGEQQCAAWGGDIGVSRGRVENDCAVGQLLITPAPKGLHQMVDAAVALEVRGVGGPAVGEGDGVVEVAIECGPIAAGTPAGEIAAAHEIGGLFRR